MSKTSSVKRVIADLERDRAELLASAALLEQVISKLLVSSQAKPKATRKPRIVPSKEAS